METQRLPAALSGITQTVNENFTVTSSTNTLTIKAGNQET